MTLTDVVASTARLFDIAPTDVRSSRRTMAISDARKVVRLVAMELGYTARQIGDELGTGESAVHQWSKFTTPFHVEMAREVSKELQP